mgnify:FL=1
MDFLAALKIVYETRNSDDELDEPFLIYSRTADLIGNSYEDKKKLSLFFAVSKRLNILMLLSSLQSDGVNAIREQYSAVADLLSESAFNRLIDALIDIVGIVTPEMDEDFYEPYDNGFDDDYSNSGAIVYDGAQDIFVGNGCGNIRDAPGGNGVLQTDFIEKQNSETITDGIYRYKSKSTTLARKITLAVGLLIGAVLAFCVCFCS